LLLGVKFFCWVWGLRVNPSFKKQFPDFPGETFGGLKEKEEKEFAEHRTRRLVLEAWDRLR